MYHPRGDVGLFGSFRVEFNAKPHDIPIVGQVHIIIYMVNMTRKCILRVSTRMYISSSRTNHNGTESRATAPLWTVIYVAGFRETTIIHSGPAKFYPNIAYICSITAPYRLLSQTSSRTMQSHSRQNTLIAITNTYTHSLRNTM